MEGRLAFIPVAGNPWKVSTLRTDTEKTTASQAQVCSHLLVSNVRIRQLNVQSQSVIHAMLGTQGGGERTWGPAPKWPSASQEKAFLLRPDG